MALKQTTTRKTARAETPVEKPRRARTPRKATTNHQTTAKQTRPVSPTNTSTNGRVDIASLRREQIIQAAIDIIAGQGLPNLSLSRIEEATGMKRGQLTYYFPTKEEILLAVFDHLLEDMIRKSNEIDNLDETHGLPPMWGHLQKMLHGILMEADITKTMRSVEYTFLAQVEYRKDFQAKLATEYGHWRQAMGAHYRISAKPVEPLGQSTPPEVIASFLMALVHGLNVQLSADPQAFDRPAMLRFLLQLLHPLFESPLASTSLTENPGNIRESARGTAATARRKRKTNGR